MKTAALIWETDLPLFSREMFMQWTLGMSVTALVMVLILGTIFVAQGEWDTLGGLILMAGGCSAGLWLLGLIIMAVMFRGRFHVRYTLDDQGLRLESAEALAKKANRAAIVLGALARSPGVAGAGLLARASETVTVRWKGGFVAVPKPARHLIALRNGWRTVMFVQCTADNFDTVLARMQSAMHKHKTANRIERASPLPFYLRHSVLIMLASLPLFALADEFHIDLFAPIFVLCFALATLWLINLFGWAVLAGLAYLAIATLLDLARVRESSLFPGETYTGFTVFGGEDAELVTLALLAAAYLVWLSWRAVRGRFLALLMRDQRGMEGG